MEFFPGFCGKSMRLSTDDTLRQEWIHNASTYGCIRAFMDPQCFHIWMHSSIDGSTMLPYMDTFEHSWIHNASIYGCIRACMDARCVPLLQDFGLDVLAVECQFPIVVTASR
jgi:hypothetical protein